MAEEHDDGTLIAMAVIAGGVALVWWLITDHNQKVQAQAQAHLAFAQAAAEEQQRALESEKERHLEL